MSSSEHGDAAPARLTRQEAKARTRDLLLRAAARVFARKGFAGASVEEIAETAGFSTGALYSNFAGKDALFLELLAERGGDRLTGAAETLARHGGDVREAAAELGLLLSDVADEDGDFALLQAEFWLYAIRRPEVMETLAERLRKPHEELSRLTAAALARSGAREGAVAPGTLTGAGSSTVPEAPGGAPEAPADTAPRVPADGGVPADAGIPAVSPDAVATVISALFGGLVRQRRLEPASVPRELFGQALVWLFDGITAGRHASATASVASPVTASEPPRPPTPG